MVQRLESCRRHPAPETMGHVDWIVAGAIALGALALLTLLALAVLAVLVATLTEGL